MKKIYAFRNYFNDFKNALSEGERKKVMRALLLLETEDRVPYHYIKYLKEGIFELRVNYGNNEFRIFHIYDGNLVVILLNAFKKKSQKIPAYELDKAIRLKYEYYESKRHGSD